MNTENEEDNASPGEPPRPADGPEPDGERAARGPGPARTREPGPAPARGPKAAGAAADAGTGADADTGAAAASADGAASTSGAAPVSSAVPAPNAAPASNAAGDPAQGIASGSAGPAGPSDTADPADPAADSPAAASGTPAKPVPADHETPAQDDPEDPGPEPAQVHHNNVYQFFNGALDARQARFGIGGAEAGGTRRRAIGRLDAGEAHALLAPYVRPPGFEGTCKALEKDGVVVLVGPPGVGKRSAAVKLLHEVTGGVEYVVLSPDRSLEELAGRPTCYLLLDRMDEGASGTADFDWRRVRDKVREKGAYLVVTTVHPVDGQPSESVRHVDWQLPDLANVVRVRLRQAGCADTLVKEAVERLPGGCRIAEAAAAAERIARGGDPERVWSEYGSSAARPVREWFAADRSLQEVAEVTTLAFVTGAGRRDFESAQTLLEPHIAPAFPDVPAGAGEAPVPRPFVDRRRSLSRNALAATEDQKHDALTRTVVVFPSPQYRLWVLEELCRTHSTEYWNGVRDWLTELVRTQPDPALQMSVASGLALLARPDFGEVVRCYLTPWAQGEAGPRGQSAAAMVLWWMCLDEALGATALTLARGWAQSFDPVMRSTAAWAFSGELGVRFPTDAVKWLWHLIRRGGIGATRAVSALADLVAVLAESRQNTSVVFRALAHRLELQRGTAVTTQLKRTTFDTVLAVLTVRDLRTGRPVCAALADRQPQLADPMGMLWAGVVCHRPRRAAALRALYDTLRALPATSEDPEPVAGRLGTAVGVELSPRERELLEAELGPLAARGDDAIAERLTGIFLSAVLSAPSTKEAHHG
ncbi:hypothetical protein GCM10022403_041790 [Streptomyces coacervatus]|uniref:Novel STAND NTPase 3 domain-containing protein n=1 Tax=Streptomyces coacervatus TaxID=647381 RepID=A0ABP7HWR0_9ACTN|nr:hypothetical protein [Streptomyces coacervatus]MDF2267234.1 hypothetical protein [Streptomyces coacervatus]